MAPTTGMRLCVVQRELLRKDIERYDERYNYALDWQAHLRQVCLITRAERERLLSEYRREEQLALKAIKVVQSMRENFLKRKKRLVKNMCVAFLCLRENGVCDDLSNLICNYL